MPDMLTAIDAAIEEATKALTQLGKKSTPQIGTTEEHAYLKAFYLSWLVTHRAAIAPCCESGDILPIDEVYQALLEANEGRPSRANTRKEIKAAKKTLVSLRSKLVLFDPNTTKLDDQPPQFSKLAPDQELQQILVRRWNETRLCTKGGANFAAAVMMGGLLEALLLARVNLESNKSPIFTAKAAPKDKTTGDPLKLKDWALKDYIDVAHELKWITKSAKDVGEVLRDFRNYIHPHKEHAHKINLTHDDGLILWGVTKSISVQVVASVP
ncbi:MAG TPA: hypothetical protein VFE46_12695 [Pirellulales bacterium]|jgi:hypothetical protein|nr:hypothetical protein [Pirellulales bacterium]